MNLSDFLNAAIQNLKTYLKENDGCLEYINEEGIVSNKPFNGINLITSKKAKPAGIFYYNKDCVFTLYIEDNIPDNYEDYIYVTDYGSMHLHPVKGNNTVFKKGVMIDQFIID